MISREVDGSGVHVITLERPKVNALCVELLDELAGVVAEVASGSPRAVVVTGGPKVFAAGADITEFARGGGADPFVVAPRHEVLRIGGAFLAALGALAGLACPTIAAVNGFALGGGCELSLACDFRVASTDARLGQPEIGLGIIPGGGGTQRLARLVGVSRAKDLIFSGRTVDAQEALEMGLVDRVVDGDATAAARAWAGELAAGPRHALGFAKRAVDEGIDLPLPEGLALEAELFADSFATPDAETGVASFLESGPGQAGFTD